MSDSVIIDMERKKNAKIPKSQIHRNYRWLDSGRDRKEEEVGSRMTSRPLPSVPGQIWCPSLE